MKRNKALREHAILVEGTTSSRCGSAHGVTRIAAPARLDWLRGEGEMRHRIRGHDWSATPLGSLERWPLSLRNALTMVLDQPLPMALAWGPDLLTFPNDAYRPLLGNKPDALGRPFLEVWEEARDITELQIAQALAGNPLSFENARFLLPRGGQTEEVFFDYSFSPVRDETGAVSGLINTAIETTARVLAERERAKDLDAMTRLHKIGAMFVRKGDIAPVLAEIVDAAIAIADADMGNIQLLAPATGDLRIVAHRGFPQWWLDFWDTVALGQGVCGTALERGERVIIENVETSPIFIGTPALDIQLRAGVRAVQSTPLISRSGQKVGMFSTHYRTPRRPDERSLQLLDLLARQAADIIERQAAEIALRESEEKYRSLFESMDQGYAECELIRDPDGRATDLRYIELNPAYERLTGIPVAEVLGRTVREVIPNFDDWWIATYDRIVRDGRPERVENQVATLGRWYEAHVYPRRGQRFTVLYEDITERKEAAERMKVLVAELQHRTRNLLTVVSVVAERTKTASSTLEDFWERLELRLEALGRSQALLSRSGPGVNLSDLTRLELAAHGADSESGVHAEGPEIWLQPNQVQMLGLALHELMTNALKHGALTSSGGRLSITWGKHDDERIWLLWEETPASPPRSPPGRRGFGRELIEEVLPYDLDAKTRLEIGPDGVRCAIELPHF
ncbi:PAS domain-containing protein [Azospirillum argentinense]